MRENGIKLIVAVLQDTVNNCKDIYIVHKHENLSMSFGQHLSSDTKSELKTEKFELRRSKTTLCLTLALSPTKGTRKLLLWSLRFKLIQHHHLPSSPFLDSLIAGQK